MDSQRRPKLFEWFGVLETADEAVNAYRVSA